ncbi:YARHG domain-containing protein [Hominifimenecus microfluidus]|uniref:YARHG domain-containing protein n=1 Tax=Hominifimenecus microfluidus TaxID=2885348 RepID=UPI0032C0309B
MQDNIRKICQKTLLIAAFAGCMGCSSAKETTASATIAQESQEKTSEAATTTVAAVESTTAAVATVAQPTSTAESPSSIAETTVAASETATSALESTRSVEPVYFEGDIGEIRSQKMKLAEGNHYCESSNDYFENVLGDTGVSNSYELFPQTAERYFTAEDFADCPEDILVLAKNEIYARHGRMFLDREIYEYFLTRMWYEPTYAPEEFDESCLNEYEKANIELLVSLGA